MFFSRLVLAQFRNYDALETNFSRGINCLTGLNGEGKTNLLEAVHFLSMTRGFISRGENIALKDGENYFMIEGTWMEGDEEHIIQCNYVQTKGKKMIMDGSPLSKMSDHIGKIPLIAVLPNDTQLVHGIPPVRRKFLDSFISQYDHEYLKKLIEYEKALEQRNAQLSLFIESKTFDAQQLSLWNRWLFPAGIYIHEARKKFLEIYFPVFDKFFHRLVSGKEQPSIQYETNIVNNSEKGWEEMFAKSLERDRYSARTSQGIHKEDIVFLVNGQQVKDYGSQGQQKTFVISLRLAQYELLESITGKTPLLLLDDIFDKLDSTRMNALSMILEKEIHGQVFVSDTSLERSKSVFGGMKKEVQFFNVKDRKVERIS